MRLVCGLEFGQHLLHGLGKLVGVKGDVEEPTAQVEGRAGKLAKGREEWRAARAARWRDVLRKMDGVQAATGQRFMGVLHQPEAVVAVYDHVGGDDGPVSLVGAGRSLAIPNLRLRND